jgi:hypothetical protein
MLPPSSYSLAVVGLVGAWGGIPGKELLGEECIPEMSHILQWYQLLISCFSLSGFKNCNSNKKKDYLF